MTLQLTGGNTSLEDMERLRRACRDTNPDWTPGDTEPWVIEAVTSLLLASGQDIVVELGGFSGACSVALAQTLTRIGSGTLLVVEHDAHMANKIRRRLELFEGLDWDVWCMDSLEAIAAIHDESIGFVWVDDSHDAPHVIKEIDALIPKMKTDGLMLFHDVCGGYRLHHVVQWYGGYSLNLPRVSSSGGLGLLQVRPSTRTRPPLKLDWSHLPGLPDNLGGWTYVYGEDGEPQ